MLNSHPLYLYKHKTQRLHLSTRTSHSTALYVWMSHELYRALYVLVRTDSVSSFCAALMEYRRFLLVFAVNLRVLVSDFRKCENQVKDIWVIFNQSSYMYLNMETPHNLGTCWKAQETFWLALANRFLPSQSMFQLHSACDSQNSIKPWKAIYRKGRE